MKKNDGKIPVIVLYIIVILGVFLYSEPEYQNVGEKITYVALVVLFTLNILGNLLLVILYKPIKEIYELNSQSYDRYKGIFGLFLFTGVSLFALNEVQADNLMFIWAYICIGISLIMNIFYSMTLGSKR